MGEEPGLTLKGIAENPRPLIDIVANVFPDVDEASMRSIFRLDAFHADVLRQLSKALPLTDPVIQNYKIGDGSLEALQGLVLQTLQDPGQQVACCPDHRGDWDWHEPSLYPQMALDLFADVVQALYRRAIDEVREGIISHAQAQVDAGFDLALGDHPWLIFHRERPRVTLQQVDSPGVTVTAEGGGNLGQLLEQFLDRRP